MVDEMRRLIQIAREASRPSEMLASLRTMTRWVQLTTARIGELEPDARVRVKKVFTDEALPVFDAMRAKIKPIIERQLKSD